MLCFLQIYVPGHAGLIGNERADALANAGAMKPLPETECGSDFVGQFENLTVASREREYENRRKDSGFEDFNVSGKRDQNYCDGAKGNMGMGCRFQGDTCNHYNSYHDHYHYADQENFNDFYEDGYENDFDGNSHYHYYDNNHTHFDVYSNHFDGDNQENLRNSYQVDNTNSAYEESGIYQECFDGNYEYYDGSYKDEFNGFQGNSNQNCREHYGDFHDMYYDCNYQDGYYENGYEGYPGDDYCQSEFYGDFEGNFDSSYQGYGNQYYYQDNCECNYQDNCEQGYYDGAYDGNCQNNPDQDYAQDNFQGDYQDYSQDGSDGYYQHGCAEYDHDNGSYQQDHDHTDSNHAAPEVIDEKDHDNGQDADKDGSSVSDDKDDNHDGYCNDSDSSDDYYYY